MAARIREQWLSILIACLALGVAATGTAVAAGTVVSIADGTNSTQIAKVDANGRLAVTLNNSPTVTARPTAPLKPFLFGKAITPTCCTSITPTALNGVALSSITVVPTSGITAPGLLFLYAHATPAGTTCPALSSSSTSATVIFFYVGPKATTQLTFPTPLTVAQGQCLYGQALDTSGNDLSLYLTGYQLA